MARYARRRPARLGEKLLQIRNALELSQDGMLKRLGLEDRGFRSSVSSYELGNSEPELITLLTYARLVGVSVDVLIDDDLTLPKAVRATARSVAARKARSRK
jgi:transcriptional regulator with XRE-family HTH domain